MAKRMRRSAVVSEQHSQEQQTESAIKVRQVTDVHANWSHQGELEHGKFSYQLILDDGAQETVIMPTAFHDADTIYWDTEREVLIFGKID
jgi:glucosamine 6-phosphate synthetase-like amidotransferase/phosphosugar isomerase protein